MRSKVFFLIWCGVFSINISINGQATTDVGERVVMRYFDEVLNKRKLHLLPEVFADHYLFRNVENGSITHGIQQMREFLPYLFTAFPDLHYTVNALITQNDHVAILSTVTGTHRGEFWGFVPSNRKINVAEVLFFKVKNGRIVECNGLLDFSSLKYQLSYSGKALGPMPEYLSQKMLLD